MEKYDIIAERRSLYESLKDLEEFGIEVEGERSGRGYRYHVIGRQFELAELKLLVDAIQSSKFITEKMTNRLIGKLETLVSQHDAADLRRQVFVSGRIKTMLFQIRCLNLCSVLIYMNCIGYNKVYVSVNTAS